MKNSDNTVIEHWKGGTTLKGDAIELWRWASVKAALELYNSTGMLITRGATPGKVLVQATGITKKTYKNNRKGREAAIADLDVSIKTLQAAIPHVEKP